MWTLRNGFAGSPARRYISAGGAAPAEVPGLPGGRVFFLGPSRLPEAISALEPPKSQRWFQVTGTQPEHGKGLPFRPVFAIEPETFRARHPHLMLPTELVEQLASEEPDALTAVTWLDRAINNTSVMFLLEVGDIRLLFPGDAQWGAWQPLLDDPGVRALLSVVTVYKVSHHGSHNGTPVGLVEDILPMNLMSLLSVRPIPRWANVPKSELVAALRKPGRRLLTSSGGNHEASTIEGPDGLWVEVRMPTR